MVKNLPAVERSTEIRFGKHVPDSTDQADNTIVFNASNVLVPTPYSNSVYLSPIRNRPDYTEPQVVLLMYDKNTKEITESGESANALVGGATLALTVDRANVTSNTVQFRFADNNTGFVTDSNVGISNLLPQHTVSVGSNLYIDEFGSNVLVVSGNVAVLRDMVIDGNLRVNGDTTVIYTENTAIKDAFIELGQNNTSADTTLDLGILMHRPDALSNVVIGYREGTDEFAIGYTEANPTDKTFTPKTDEDINVHVYGLTHVDANIYAHEDILVDGNVSVTEELTISNNVYAQKDLEVVGNVYVDGNVVAYKDFTLTGNAYVSGNVSVTEELTVSGNVYADKDLEVVGNVYVDGNVVAYKDFTLTGNAYVSGNVSVTEELTISNNVYAQKDLEVVGNVYVDGNVVAYKDFTLTGNAYVYGNVSVTEELTVSNNVYADKDLEVVGNVYVDGNVVAYKDLLVSGNVYVSQNVSVTEELTISGNVYAQKDLEVMGNVYVDGNVVAYKDFTLTGNAYVSGNVNVTKQLSVSGNAYVSGNVEVTKSLIVSANTHLKGPNVFVTNTMNFLNPKTAIVTDQVSNVQIRLGQLENVSNTASNPLADQVIMYDGNRWMNTFPNHSFLTIKNAEPTATLVSGNAVYISGYQNQNLARVKLARADSPLTMPAIGIVYGDDIPPDEEGLAAAYGKVNQMNTNGYQVGETLYVSNLYAGWISNLKPYYTDGTPNLIQNVGVVTRKDTNSGAMFVTGIGRANDIPNAQLITDYNDMNYVYVNDVNNDFKKIASQNLNIPLTTAVSSSSNSAANAVTLRGVSITSGGGFHGDLVVAGNVTVDTTTFHVDAETNRVGLGTTTPGYPLDVRGAANVGTLTTTTGTVTNETHSTSKDTGVLVLTQGGLGVEANIHSTNVFAVSHIAVGTSETSNTFDVRGTSNVGALVATSTHISDATAVSSKTTGALQVTGGVGIQGDIHATHANFEDVEADSVTVTDATAATDKTSGALQVTGGVGIQGDLYATNGTFTTNVYITDHTDLNNKHLAMIDTNGSLIQSPVYVAPSGKYVISAAEAEFLGNITLGGNTTLLTSTSLIVQDRIIGIGSNNSAEGLDSGIIIEHQDEGVFANIALIHHADEHRFSVGYTQNTLTDNHILNASHPDNIILRIDLVGNTIVQNSLSVSEMGTFGTMVGIATTEPIANIHVVGNAFVTSNITTNSNVLVKGDATATSKTTGALQVTGGVGVQGGIYGAAMYTDDYLIHIGDTDTKIGFPANDTFTVTTNNAERIRVNSSGSVGIGTDAPSAGSNLHVFGETTTISSDTAGSSVSPEVSLYRNQTGSDGNYLGQLRYDGKDDNGGDTLYGKITGKIKTATDGSEDGTIETALITGGTERVSVSHSGDLFHIKNGTDFQVGEVANVYVDTATSHVGIRTQSPGSPLDVRGAANVGTLTMTSGTVTDATHATSKDTGVLVVTQGGLGVEANIHSTNVFVTSHIGVGTSDTSNTFDVRGTANVGALVATSTHISDSTTSTDQNSGALIVQGGGVGIEENLNVGGVTKVWDATDATTTTSGALQVVGGLGVAKSIHATTLTAVGTTQATDTLTGAITVAGGISTQTNVHAANVYISGGLVTNTGGVAKKTYSYSGTIGDTEQPHINVCFTNHSFTSKITAQLIEGDDEISSIIVDCCGGNKGGNFPASDIKTGSVQVFGPASTNAWNVAVVTDKTTVALRPYGALDGAGEYHIFVEYTTAKTAGAVANVVQDTTEKVVFGY
ncbi:tail fiber protein [Ostreococcus tauri virus OtV5]|uniref:Uncharacterized protein n=1 Tax=Ostreococcus tauri virus OtV5 TaxID=1785753 RepID=A0A0X8DE65_9PHYC|nr:tail fiber protein [Ostreococcus tauri virus OtV5]AMA76494.1 hypothetical protein OtV5_070 [Ostreococcus tauri virus OtV5]